MKLYFKTKSYKIPTKLSCRYLDFTVLDKKKKHMFE